MRAGIGGMLGCLAALMGLMSLGCAHADSTVCTPLAVFAPGAGSGMEIIPGSSAAADRVWSSCTVDGRQAVSLEKGHWYLGFRVSDDVRKGLGPDLYIMVEFSDDELGSAHIEYNSEKEDYKRGSVFRMAGTGLVSRALIHLSDARFRGTQAGGGDFRLRSYGRLTLTKVELYDSKPGIAVTTDQQWADRMRRTLRGLPRNPKPRGIGYTLADPYEVTEAQFKDRLMFGHCSDDATAALCSSLGTTSIESYVTWETVESRGRDQWDWSYWDRQTDVLKRHDMKWAPMVMLGPAYCVPAWFRGTADHLPYRCLEHDTDTKIESLWNPNLPKWIDRFLKEFAGRYGKSGILDYVLLGISGDYGEAIYPAVGGWTEIVPGPYHSHFGFWCGDRYAMADFRRSMERKYKTVDAVNDAWGTHFESFDAVDVPARGEQQLAAFRRQVTTGGPQMRRRWLDFIDWYRAAMTNWADQWMSIARKYLPNTPIFLCTGGLGQPELGCDFAEQCRIAGKYGAGVRITNEGSEYKWNYVATRWVASAARHYGAGFGFEPAAVEDERGVVARIYNATASGASHLHDYTTNMIRYKSTMDVQRKSFKYLFHVKDPVVPVALWYPNVHLTLMGSDFNNPAAQFRDYVDYDYVDETMLRTDALSRFKVLVVLHGQIMETGDAERIANWVEKGGRVVVMGVPRFESVEATGGPEKLLFGDSPQGRTLGKGRVTRVAGWDELASLLRSDLAGMGYPIYDLRKDGIYGTQIGTNRFLFLNTAADSPVDIEWHGSTTSRRLPGGAITDVTIPQR